MKKRMLGKLTEKRIDEVFAEVDTDGAMPARDSKRVLRDARSSSGADRGGAAGAATRVDSRGRPEPARGAEDRDPPELSRGGARTVFLRERIAAAPRGGRDVERGDLNRAEPDGSIRDPPTAGNGELDLDEFITGMVKFKPKEEEHGKTSMKSGIVWFRREGPAAERRFCPLVLVLLCASKRRA